MFAIFVPQPVLSRIRSVVHLGAALALVGGVSACAASKAPDQLLVKGDKFEITLQEYDQLLRRLPPVTKEAVAPLRRALLQQLIDEKLLAEAAVGAGMDHDPASSQAIAAARRTILAQAYVQTLTGNAPKPNEAAIEAYYTGHPALFANRRRFVVEEYVLRSDFPDIRSYLDTLDQKDFPTLAALLTSKVPGLQPTTVTRFTDELPDRDGVVDQLSAGSNIVYQSAGQVHLGRIEAIAVEPVSLEIARPRIEQTLTTQRMTAITEAAVKTLRRSRNVEIVNANLRAASASRAQGTPKS